MEDLAAVIAAKARAAAAKMSELQGVISPLARGQAVDWSRPLNAAPEPDPSTAVRMLPDATGDAEASRPTTTTTTTTTTSHRVNGALVPVSGAHAAAHGTQLTLAAYRERTLIAEAKKRKRREGSRWAPLLVDEDEECREGRLLAYKSRIDALTCAMESPVPIARRLPPVKERSPSPPPRYDRSTGQRINTREQRVFDAWDTERRECVAKALEMDPLFKPPAGHRPLVHELRLYVPHKQYPGYNFTGLIIGPRGSTQKRLEKETGAYIRIRGREMHKEGTFRPPLVVGVDDGRDDELHVHISADTVEKVDAAARMVHPLLTPLDPDQNPHKQKQLRELAEINGTVYDVGRLEKQRLAQEEEAKNDYKLSGEMQVKVDAMYRKDVAAKLAAEGKVVDGDGGKGLDDEYENFLSELTGNLGEGAVPGHESKQSVTANNAAKAGASIPGVDAATIATAARNPWALPHLPLNVPNAHATPVHAHPPSGPGWAPGAAPEHLRKRQQQPAMPPPAGPAPGAATSSKPVATTPAEVYIPSTLAIDARLALSGLYGAGIAAAAAVTNSVAARRVGGSAGGEYGTAVAGGGSAVKGREGAVVVPAGAAAAVGDASADGEIPEEAVDDEYARMMAELGG